MPFIYFLVGQVVWFACVIGAARDLAWAGELLALVLLIVHLARSRSPVTELKLVCSMAAIGYAWENVLARTGLLVYPHPLPFGLAPLWLLALWAVFAAQLNATFGWLKPHLAIAAVLGAVAGPLSFRAGAALGALHFTNPWRAALCIGAAWAVLLPVAIALSRRWPGEVASRAPT